ncbi:MAG TPA: SRPBCC family protein [Nitrososphaeraceae archaeon]|nr:SRPBCC family protein [Nitrososphaeraceae archaeon]
MTRITNVKKHTSRKKTLTAMTVVVAVAIASVLMTSSVWQIPQATASSLEEIKASREISAPIDQVWNVVSDIDNDTKYWPTVKTIKNINTTAINMTANTTEREVTLVVGPQGETITHQFVTVNPEQFVVETNITEGPVTGTRVLILSPSSNNTNATKIDVLWNVDLSGIPIFGRGFAKDGIMRTTEEALSNIAAEVEAK